MTPTTASTPPGESGDTDMRGTYVKVLAIEVVVLVALWLFSRYFS